MSSPWRHMGARRLPPLPGRSNITSYSMFYNKYGKGRGTVHDRTSPTKKSKYGSIGYSCSPSKEDLQQPRSSRVKLSTGLVLLTPETVKQYLSSHPRVLNEYVQDLVNVETLEKWLAQKKGIKLVDTTNDAIKKESNKFSNPDINQVTCDLIAILKGGGAIGDILHMLTNVIGAAIGADKATLYISAGNDLCKYSAKPKSNHKVELGSQVANHAVKTKCTVLVQDLKTDERFSKEDVAEPSKTKCVLCIPIILPEDSIMGAMEWSRSSNDLPFIPQDLQTATALTAWASAAIFQGQLNQNLTKQARLNTFLLDVFKIIFEDIVSMQKLVTNIMSFTKDLVNADRAALFLVDEEKGELCAEVFDLGSTSDTFKKKNSIRFPMSKGIAGHVATTKEVVNIKDAYLDPRFNREVDKTTGYRTKNLLTMPIMNKGNVIGVVQMVNKVNDMEMGFTVADEKNFETFAVYCAMALYLSNMYNSLQHQNTMHLIAIEQLSYHQAPAEDEYRMLISKPFVYDLQMDVLGSYEFHGVPKFEAKLPQIFLMMANKLFGAGVFSLSKLARFILTVRKNYRPIPYHNWHHGFNVAHAVFCMLIRTMPEGIMTERQAMAMFIGAVCHDLDHRGYTNAGMKHIDHPIAALYGTSTMEEHHYKQTIMILQQDGNDIFEFLPEEEYKTMLVDIHEAILATDLAPYFALQKKLRKELDDGTFNIHDPQSNKEVCELMMTAADVCAICKPWPVQDEIAQMIFEEFWQQGDEEKERGLKLIPMMDRDNKHNVPKEQVGFITFVTKPCYEIVSRILPMTIELLCGCENNLIQYKHVMAGESTDAWEDDLNRIKAKYGVEVTLTDEKEND